MGDIILAVIGNLWGILWLILFFKNKKKYKDCVAQIDGSEYFMKELFPVGYAIKEIVHVDINSINFQKKENKISELYGIKMAKQLVLTDLVAQITYAATFIPIGIYLTVIMGEPFWLLVSGLLTLFLVIYVEYDKSNKVQKRREKINREFPHIISQMALLINAGMPLREALKVTAGKEERVLCQEIKILTDDMSNGIPDYEALSAFADRCGTDNARKFASLVTQNIRKGSAELAASLMELSSEVWRNRVSAVKEEGEKASARLMVPILIIFIGILVMVVVPMMKDMNL